MPERKLTVDQVRAELARMKPGAADALGVAIAGHAKRYGQDPRELLSEAVSAFVAPTQFGGAIHAPPHRFQSYLNLLRKLGLFQPISL